MTNRKLSIEVNAFTKMTIVGRPIFSPHSVFSMGILISIRIHLKDNIPIEIHETNDIFFCIWITSFFTINCHFGFTSCLLRLLVLRRVSNIMKYLVNKLATCCWSNPFSSMNSTFDENLKKTILSVIKRFKKLWLWPLVCRQNDFCLQHEDQQYFYLLQFHQF